MPKILAVLLSALTVVVLADPPASAQQAPPWSPGVAAESVDDVDGPLPRWREGGTPPVDPNQSLQPFAIDLTGYQMAPATGVMASPPEYAPTRGVMYRWGMGWNSVVNECVVKLTSDPAHDDIAYVVVQNATTQANAEAALIAAGADMSKVVFYVAPGDSIWLRDYGPHFTWQDDALTIVDSHYYPTRWRDNFIPTKIARDRMFVPDHHIGLYYSGGNFQPGPDRMAVVSSLINQDNPEFSTAEIAELYRTHQGIDTLHVFPRLPASVDGTGHIDMWMYLVDEDTVIIGEFKPGSNATAIQVTNDAVPYMESLGFEVFRVPAWNQGSTHYTYTNAYRVNDRIFVPSYVSGNPNYADEDADALAAWQAAAGPGVEIVPIDCYSIIPAAGAIHCIVMQVPEHTPPTPAVHLLEPHGNEVLVPGSTYDVVWGANDPSGPDFEVAGIDLLYSTDGGGSYTPIAVEQPDTGHYLWTVPDDTTVALDLKVVARDALLQEAESTSAAPAILMDANQTVYDFSTNAGVDRWAWGHATSTWSQVNANRHPVTSELTPSQYAAAAVSDAPTGSGDSDPLRFIAPLPGSGNETTHVFEFTLAEDLDQLIDVGILWEGYGEDCTQMELYIWDDVLGNWTDGKGNRGEDSYAANYAGNRDNVFDVHIREDFARFIDGSGRITFMTYADRSADESFHDYVAVTTTWIDCQRDLGFAGPGNVGLALCGGNLMQGGVTGNFLLDGAVANQPAWLVFGAVVGPTPLKGGTLVPFPFLLLAGGLSTDGLGQLAFPVPGNAGPPVRLIMQAVVSDGAGGFEFSNAVEAFLGT